MGYKYLLPTNTQPQLIEKAWNDFAEHLRWCVHFAHEMVSNPEYEAESYDPDYKVSKVRHKAPKGDYILEATIAAGDRYVQQTIADILHKDELHHPSGKFIRELQEYLEAKDYIILPTDENLGCSVVMRE